MRILITARWPTGGIRSYFRYVYGQRELQDHDYCLVTPKMGHAEYFREIFPHDRFKYVETGPKLSALCWATTCAYRWFKPDLAHSHGFIAAFATAPGAWLTRVPHLFTSHDMLLPEQFSGLNGMVKLRALGTLLRLCTHIMTVSEDSRNNLETCFPYLSGQGRITAIRSGVDIAAYSTNDRRNLKQELGIETSTPLLGFFGRFMGPKGFPLLVKATANLLKQGYPMYVACFGWGGFIREEQAELRAAGLNDIFRFLPHTDDMGAALRAVDAVVVPSRWETCPLLPMEAMVAGTPVIASNCIGLREVVQDTPALVFENGSSDDLTARMRDYLNTPDVYHERASAFRQKAAERFDARSSARRLHDLYSRLVP